MFSQNKIEIIVPYYFSEIESLFSSWNSNDLHLAMDYDNHEQPIFSAFSPHIENIKSETKLIRRIVSLNILLNGSLFVARAETMPKIEFSDYYIQDRTIARTIVKDGLNGFCTDTIEEYPFENNEDFYIKEKNRNLPKNANLNAMLFSISKFDFVIRTLLYQAGIIFHNGINGKILTWTTLYKMVDTIKTGCKDIGIDYKTLIDKNSLGRFTVACNNPTILGIYARHGGKGKNITRIQPITHIEEAISLILCFANRFCKMYATNKGYITINNLNLSKCEYQEYSDPQVDYSKIKDFL